MNKKSATRILAFGLAFVLWGCNQGSSTANPARGTAHPSSSPVAQTATEGSYVCHMHPEVTGKAGDDCPKCGMELVPKESSSTAPGGISMKFKAEPDKPKAGESVSLVFRPVSSEQPTAGIGLDLEHTKKIHLIIVSDDLSWFDHIHPVELTDGTYRVTEKFPKGGKYTLFADYKPTGGDHIVDRVELTVKGDEDSPVVYEADRLTSDAGDDFSAVLTPEGGKFLSGAPSHLEGKILRNGKELDVNTLEDYLGAKAHMVVISLDGKEYLHVHPGVEGSSFDLHTTFEKPGWYRGWLQFQSAGKIYTTDFVFNVAQGEVSGTPSPSTSGHESHDH